MSSKYNEAFDSLKSNDDVKRERAERIKSAMRDSQNNTAQKAGAISVAKEKRYFLKSRRGVALLTAMAVFASAIIISVPMLMGNNLLNAVSRLKETYVDMEGVTAFGVWNAPESENEAGHISNVAYVNNSKLSPNVVAYADEVEEEEGDETLDEDEEDDGVISGDWSDEDRYDWESDYDWDPTKANVLIAIDEEGKINEVVYERTNGRGQVRQDTLGNAAAVYVSNGFTYVMYVDDDEWEFWKDINFAQYMHSPNGFGCHHEREQTVVIHNETGKVFALKDLIPQVNELSGATNHTMQVYPLKDDLLFVGPMYGNLIPQWYSVIYDESSQNIRYEYVLPVDSNIINQFNWNYNLRSVRRDIYGQLYLFAGYDTSTLPRIGAGIVNLPSYTRYDNAILFSTANGIMFGTDGRMYAFDEGKLKVFGKNFELIPIEAGTSVSFEGIAGDFQGRAGMVDDGIAYKLDGGFLYSMFGEVWAVANDGTLHARERLEGSFPRFADDGYLIGGEIIAFVYTKDSIHCNASENGTMAHITFTSDGGVPRAVITPIIKASEISVTNHRMVVEQNENPWSMQRGDTKYFLITVQNGVPKVDYFAYGKDGGVLGLTKPITEPVILT